MKSFSMSKITFLLSFTFCVAILPAQNTDSIYNQKIKEYTTDKRFLPASVLNLTNDPIIPSPLKFFGSIIGAPGIMHRTNEIYDYYKALAASSPNIKIQQVGTSEEGRPINMVIIGNESTLQQADFYKNQLSLLADPRKIGTQNVQDILKNSKPVFYLNGGMHSPEMGSPEMLMELAYRLITSNTDEIKNIRNKIIVLINPVSEPDGRDKQVDWYYRYSKARTSFDDGFRTTPPYWGKYVFHDNNRDGIQVSQAITKSIFNIYFDWHPTVMLDLHESVPLLYISTGTGPYNETIDPITIGEWQIMANHDITTLAAQGLPGAFTWAFYDGWYPGYGIWVANNHNSIGRFYETFGNAGANTYLRDLSQMKYAGDPVTNKEWYRPDPATAQVLWSARNNINYMEAGVLASLSYTADNAKLLLHNFYQKGVNNIRKGKEEKLRCFVIPSEQRDPAMAAYLINQLRKQQIEVHYLDTAQNNNTYVILLDQPYRNLAVSLLTKQFFSKEAKFPPYDDIAWTLGYLYGVDVQEKQTIPFALNKLKLLTNDVIYEGKINGTGNQYILHYKAQNSLLPAFYWLKSTHPEISYFIADEKIKPAGSKDSLQHGSVLFKDLPAEAAKEMSSLFGLDLLLTKNIPVSKQHQVTLPRVAIYHTWFNTQDEGWTRYTFEQLGIPYSSIQKDDLKKGDLRKRFDLILIPNVSGNASNFLNEIDTRFGPMPYTKTKDFPSHGYPDSTQDMTGGPGYSGLQYLKEFVEAGGVLVSLDNSSAILAELGMVKALKTYEPGGLFHPGSVVQAKIRKTNNPVVYGFPEIFPLFKGNGKLLTVDKPDRDMMLLQYGTNILKDEKKYTGPVMGLPNRKEDELDKTVKPDGTPYVVSGMVRNEETIIGQGAIFSIPLGNGKIIAFTFDPLHRFLNLHDAPLLWNVLINWDHLKK